MERQKDTGFFNDLLLGKVTKKAGAKGERSGSDAVTPGVEILIFLIPQLSVVMCSQTEQFTADTISCWAVSFLAVPESSGKMTGVIQPRTPVIFSFGMSHMFGCAPAQRHNVGRTLHLHVFCLNQSAGRSVEDVVASLESSGVAVTVSPAVRVS